MDYLPPVEERERLLQRRWPVEGERESVTDAGGRWSEREDLRVTPVAGVRESGSEGDGAGEEKTRGF
jgi:hypothetical protein